MQLRKKKSQLGAYDIWDKEEKSSKLHPSEKRNKKIALPHPGQSYNPDPKDHERLLNKVLKKELEYQKKQQTLNKALKVKVDHKELKKADKDELESGIKHLLKKPEDKNKKNDDHEGDSSLSTDEAYSDYDEKDFQAIIKDKKVVEKRKSRQQRMRQLKDKLQRKAAKLRKLKNIRLSKFDSIKRMIKELDKQQKEMEEKRRKKHKKIKNERLGQRFEQSDPIYCLSDELPSSLRQTSCPMNAIVREQLESFQSRLMVEPTSYQIKSRKYKKKEFNRLTAAEQEEV